MRVTKDLNVWKAMTVGMVLSDALHIFAYYSADPQAFFDPFAWGWRQWVGEGTLILGMLLRIVFLLNVGVKRTG